jgi:hypothetical protein
LVFDSLELDLENQKLKDGSGIQGTFITGIYHFMSALAKIQVN